MVKFNSSAWERGSTSLGSRSGQVTHYMTLGTAVPRRSCLMSLHLIPGPVEDCGAAHFAGDATISALMPSQTTLLPALGWAGSLWGTSHCHYDGGKRADCQLTAL